MQERIEGYLDEIDALAAVFTHAQHVNGDQEPHTVFECVESLLVQPLTNNP